jgi:hypothetical protein
LISAGSLINTYGNLRVSGIPYLVRKDGFVNRGQPDVGLQYSMPARSISHPFQQITSWPNLAILSGLGCSASNDLPTACCQVNAAQELRVKDDLSRALPEKARR